MSPRVDGHTGGTAWTTDARLASVAGASFAQKRPGHSRVPSSESLAVDSQHPGAAARGRGPGGRPCAPGPFPDTGRCRCRNARGGCLLEPHAAPRRGPQPPASEGESAQDGQFRGTCRAAARRNCPGTYPTPVPSLMAAGPVPALQMRKRGWEPHGWRESARCHARLVRLHLVASFRQQEATLS